MAKFLDLGRTVCIIYSKYCQALSSFFCMAPYKIPVSYTTLILN